MNPYEVLGVDKNASPDEIKKAYRKLSKEHHPDVGGDENKFKDIASAYDILSNPEKKQQYDTFGSGGGSGNPFGGFEDILSQMFGGNPFGRQRAKRGADIQVSVKMSLTDVITGAVKKITYQKNGKCAPCNGKGGEESIKCNSCNGTGQTVKNIQTGFGMMQQAISCMTCEGTGYIVKNKCNTCRGAGVAPKMESINVNIPAGVSNGMQLNMQGAGHEIKDGINGDLFIRIDEIPDDNFRREGNNLNHEIWISISEAVLGTSKTIKAPTGELKFNIEPGCDSGKVFNFSGKGTPNVSHDGRHYGSGNLFVKVNVKIPKKVNNETKSLFEELKKHEM